MRISDPRTRTGRNPIRLSNIKTGGKGVYAPNVQLAEHPGNKQDTQMRSKMESARRGQEQLQVSIVAQGWLKPGGGGLWKPGEKVMVKSPMLIVNEQLDLVSATFSQDSKSGTRTTLELKRPGGDNEGSADDGEKPNYDPASPQAQAAQAPPKFASPGARA